MNPSLQAKLFNTGTPPCLLYDKLLGKGGVGGGGGCVAAARWVHCDAHNVKHLVSMANLLCVQEVLTHFILQITIKMDQNFLGIQYVLSAGTIIPSTKMSNLLVNVPPSFCISFTLVARPLRPYSPPPSSLVATKFFPDFFLELQKTLFLLSRQKKIQSCVQYT